MVKHISYEAMLDRPYDFIVQYELIDQVDHNVKITQGMRSDFCFENEYLDCGYMIWPEFVNKSGEVVQDSNEVISKSGYAHMWILIEESRVELKEKLKVGAIGYFLFGSHKVARAEIVNIESFEASFL